MKKSKSKPEPDGCETADDVFEATRGARQRATTAVIADAEGLPARDLRVEKFGFGVCQACRMHATLRALEVTTAKVFQAPGEVYVPRWCALIALCGGCWDRIVAGLAATATLDRASLEMKKRDTEAAASPRHRLNEPGED